MKLEATHMRGTLYAVRPEGACGTCGWINGKAWTVDYVKARTPQEAIDKSARRDSPRWRTSDANAIEP